MSTTAVATRLFATRPSTRTLLDAAIATAALALTLTQLSHGGITLNSHTVGDLDATGVALAVCTAGPILVWRRFPLGVFAVTATAGVLLAGLSYPYDLAVGSTAALYLLTASKEKRSPWSRIDTVVVVGLFVAYLGATAVGQAAFPSIELLHTGLASAGAWFAGERTRLRREQMAEFKHRAIRAEKEAETDRLLALAEERARIARDLHDSAGHAISVIVVRAGAARLRHHENPARSLQALTAIEGLARRTAEEIDQIVVTLRNRGPEHGRVEAPPGLASLGTLIANQRAAGLEVRLETTGRPPRSVGDAADQATYRIVQEALTNAVRYGAGCASVTLSFGDDALELTVTNPVIPDEASRSGGGHGLIGMRERAAMLGGTLNVERADGTFRIQALIPFGGHSS